MGSSLQENLQRLGQEKALIASGQELVVQLIQGITMRMGELFLGVPDALDQGCQTGHIITMVTILYFL